MIDQVVLIRYHEIGLKGGNRTWFEERLQHNIRKTVRRALNWQESQVEVERLQGRLVLKCEWTPTVEEALTRVFGIMSFSPAEVVETKMPLLIRVAIEQTGKYLQRHPETTTFRVFTRRSDKVFAGTSMDIDREIGSAVSDAFPSLKVKLSDPDCTVGVELRNEKSYIWTEKIPGPKGLPVGSNGHLLTLLSGGLDSPVAAIQTLKRGSTTSLVHFFGEPFVGQEVLEKIEDLGRLVNRYQPVPQPLQVVSFGKIQEKIALATRPKMRTILYRRMMVRIASLLAKKLGAQALVTGESLGQVASQTLENMTAIDQASTLMVIRPLVTWDKDDIIQQAGVYGTYEASIRPAVDCCTLFADRHPLLRATAEQIAEEESKFNVDALMEEALANIRTRRL